VGQFGDGVARFGIKTAEELRVTARMIVYEMFRRVIIKTPVDTGAARYNWMTSIGGNGDNPPVEPEGRDKSGNKALGRVALAMKTYDGESIAWLSNGLPYARVLEYGLYPNPPLRGSWVKGKGWVVKSVGGYSRQAPQGMVRVTALEFGGVVRSFGGST
jgi:hypothetical protein